MWAVKRAPICLKSTVKILEKLSRCCSIVFIVHFEQAFLKAEKNSYYFNSPWIDRVIIAIPYLILRGREVKLQLSEKKHPRFN